MPHKRCKACIAGILGGIFWLLLSFLLHGAVDWVGAIIFGIVFSIICILISMCHWRFTS